MDMRKQGSVSVERIEIVRDGGHVFRRDEKARSPQDICVSNAQLVGTLSLIGPESWRGPSLHQLG